MDDNGIANGNMPGSDMGVGAATEVATPAPTVPTVEQPMTSASTEVPTEDAPTESAPAENASATPEVETAPAAAPVIEAGEYKLPDRLDAPTGKDYLISCGVCAGLGGAGFVVLAALILWIMKSIMCAGTKGACTAVSGWALVVSIVLIFVAGALGGFFGPLLYWKKLHKVPLGATAIPKPPFWMQLAGAGVSCVINFCLMPIIMLVAQ